MSHAPLVFSTLSVSEGEPPFLALGFDWVKRCLALKGHLPCGMWVSPAGRSRRLVAACILKKNGYVEYASVPKHHRWVVVRVMGKRGDYKHAGKLWTGSRLSLVKSPQYFESWGWALVRVWALDWCFTVVCYDQGVLYTKLRYRETMNRQYTKCI